MIIKLIKYLKESINYGDTRIYIWIKNRRKNRAIALADEISKLNNGRRYYVLPHHEDPDRYMVRNKKQLEKLKREGKIKTSLNFIDYLREAVYHT